MNIYLIDDDDAKVSFIEPLLKKLREKVPEGGLTFEDGFGKTTSDTYLDSAALMRAVTDPEGICLIDMKFPIEAEIVVDELMELLRADSDGAEIIRKFNSMCEGNTIDYYLGLLLAAICKQKNTKCLTVSTAGTAAVVESLRDQGFSVSPFPYVLKADNTVMIEKVVSAILAQVDFLADLKTRTRNWFRDHGSYSQLWHTWNPDLIVNHQTLLQDNWPWFPQQWWSSDESARNLHENLKHLCGSTACWMGDSTEPRSLSVGAAYLLALMVMEHRFPGWTRRTPSPLVRSFEGFNSATLRWLPEQDADVAERMLKAYIDVLLAVGVLKNTDQPGISNIVFDRPGRKVRLVLAWDTEHVAELALHTKGLFAGKASLTVPLGPVSKTVEALLKLHALSQISNKGFGAPGYFYIEEKTFHVGS